MDLVIYAHLTDLWCCRCAVYHTSTVVTYKLVGSRGDYVTSTVPLVLIS